jgi:hypothetical protein
VTVALIPRTALAKLRRGARISIDCTRLWAAGIVLERGRIRPGERRRRSRSTAGGLNEDSAITLTLPGDQELRAEPRRELAQDAAPARQDATADLRRRPIVDRSRGLDDGVDRGLGLKVIVRCDDDAGVSRSPEPDRRIRC